MWLKPSYCKQSEGAQSRFQNRDQEVVSESQLVSQFLDDSSQVRITMNTSLSSQVRAFLKRIYLGIRQYAHYHYSQFYIVKLVGASQDCVGGRSGSSTLSVGNGYFKGNYNQGRRLTCDRGGVLPRKDTPYKVHVPNSVTYLNRAPNLTGTWLGVAPRTNIKMICV